MPNTNSKNTKVTKKDKVAKTTESKSETDTVSKPEKTAPVSLPSRW